jgi:hypothetical protein
VVETYVFVQLFLGTSSEGLYLLGFNPVFKYIWFPVNFLLIESLQKLHHYYGAEFTVECPTGSGVYMTLWEVAAELSRRLVRIFLETPEGKRPVNGATSIYAEDPHWCDLILFHEYFHGDDGSGIGASHQTGWTGLVAKLLQQSGE